jgi:hypothetical protein
MLTFRDSYGYGVMLSDLISFLVGVVDMLVLVDSFRLS